jgi:hypothetical protein
MYLGGGGLKGTNMLSPKVLQGHEKPLEDFQMLNKLLRVFLFREEPLGIAYMYLCPKTFIFKSVWCTNSVLKTLKFGTIHVVYM